MAEPSDPSSDDRRRVAVSPRWLGIGALTVLTAVVAFASLGGKKSATSLPITSSSEVEVSPTSAETVAPLTVAPGLPPYPPLPRPRPDGGLYSGRPPMFVLVSFDGAADQKLLDYWTDVTKRAQAHMTMFLSAVYLLGDDHKDLYHGPRHDKGESAIGFAQNKTQPVNEWLTTTVNGLRAAQQAGHELENHFAGHWCGPSGVDSWNRADWAKELNQFDDLANNVNTNNNLNPPVGSPFLWPPTGSRTPCLEGNLKELYPVVKARGYRFDASGRRTLGEWPKDVNNLWQFGFPTVNIEGVSRPMLTVDFSLRENMDPKRDATDAQAADISRRVYEGYKKGFNDVYYGNRAPFELSNHFVHFSKDAYNKAIEKLLVEVCTMPEVECVNYRELTDWADAHKDAIVGYEKGNFLKLPKPPGT